MIKPEHITNPSGGIDVKILAAFERISQVLRTMAWNQGKSLSLNPAQSQVLIFLNKHPHLQIKVSSLAREFNISNASMSDTIRLLEAKKFLQKTYVSEPSKTFTLSLTAQGKEAALKADGYADALKSAICNLPSQQSEALLGSLSSIIEGLYHSGVSPVQRMCKTCRYHDRIDGQSYCHLLEKSLAPSEIQFDCADHILLQSYHMPFR